MKKIFTKKYARFKFGMFLVFVFFILPVKMEAAVLLPGNISTCGELAVPGTYTLTGNVNGGANTCFLVSSDNVTINGAGYTITGSASTAIDGRAYTSGSFTEGAHAYTNLIINDLTLSGYATGINLSGNDDYTGNGVNNGYAGDAGDVAIFYSVVSSVLVNGGATGNYPYGGVGGNISFTDTNLDISNSTISTLGGQGTADRNSGGGLAVTYTGTLNKTNVTLSALVFLNDNGTSYPNYPGGSFPMFPGNISTCGTLFSSGTYTLIADITNVASTCFLVASNSVTLDGNGHSVNATSSNSDYAISVGDHTDFNLITPQFISFSNLISAATPVSISGNNLDFSNQHIEVGALTLDYTGTFENTGATVSSISSYVINGNDYGSYGGGVLPTVPGNISRCDELVLPGTYTLTQDILNITGTCFVIGASGVTLDGAGHTLNATSSNTSFAFEVGSNNSFILASTTVTGFTDLINSSGSVRITSEGSLDLSNKNINAGSLVLSYVDVFSRANAVISALSNLTINGNNYGAFAGGGFPRLLGDTDSCGTLTVSGTYTLTQNITDISGTCFVVRGDNITINGAGYSLIATNSNSNFAIDAGSSSNFILASTTVTNFTKLVTSSSSVVISGHNLDLSNKYIDAGSLTLTYTGVLNKIGTTISNLSSLIVNGVSQGAQSAGSLLTWQAVQSNRSWTAIASSIDGRKLAAIGDGQIYTSNDSGLTWTPRDSARGWMGIASSADGTKLVAILGYGQIYTSTDSGVTWTPRGLTQGWNAVASSADGVYLVAAVNGSDIYTSTDSGVTWVAKGPSGLWSSVASSADGSKIVATYGITSNGQIYTSSDYGTTWTARDSSRNWSDVAASADGTKLVATVLGGQIYTSTDSGATWTARDSSRQWKSVASSADGVRLVAVVNGGGVYRSSDSGVTWSIDASASASNQSWYAVSTSADGTKIAALVSGEKIHIHEDNPRSLFIDTFAPKASTNISTLSPVISWGGATACYYSYDNFVSTSTANCAMNGADIVAPALGSRTLYLKGIDYTGAAVQKSIPFFMSLPITITAPVLNSTITSWTPVINWDPTSAGNITNCYYSYDNFVSTSTANCANAGNDIIPPLLTGNTTLYVKTINSNGNIGINSVDFLYSISAWTPRDSDRNWWGVASNADGTKLAATLFNAQMYTSTDSGATWTVRGLTANLRNIVSSDDGTKLLIMTVGALYTSADSGATWTGRAFGAVWGAIATSADGTKLAAAHSGGLIYTSTDSGVTWTGRSGSGSRSWVGMASSADGTKLAAIVNGGQIYTSTDSGVTWTARESSRSWKEITSSADGTKLAAIVNGGQIYTSTDSGVTWTAREQSRSWNNITGTPDGTKLFATANTNVVYVSTDSGVTWTATIGGGSYYDIATNSDGTKLVAAVSGGKIYTYNSSTLSLSIIRPSAGSTIMARAWSALVNWGSSVSCYYSYDNFVSTSTATCASQGTDIPYPTSMGLKTLYVKGTDALNNVITKFSTFTFDMFPWTARADSRSWGPVASSADGMKLIASVYFGFIYTSIDSGITWTARESSRYWYGVASSADGTKLAAIVNGGQIYTSVNSGATWTARDSVRSWYGITSSADGTKLAAIVNGGQIYTSTDSGVTWTAQASGSRNWYAIASSADGTKLAAVVQNGQIYTSVNSGVTWTARDSSRQWISVASSADGTKLVAAVNNGGQIYTSGDSGATWTARDSNRNWARVAISADGTKIAATVASGQIYTSTDSGLTWNAQESNRSWGGITLSADGTKLTAAVGGGQIYTATLVPTVLNITASSTVTSWPPTVDWSRSLTCQYSYDNSTWSNASCLNGGSDITASSSVGTKTLFLKGNNSDGTISTSSIYFTFDPPLSAGSVSRCGLISSAGTYTLSQNITGVSGTCFTVNANNVTINGAGYTVTAVGGNTSYAFVSQGDGLTFGVYNIVISGFGGGVDGRGRDGDSGDNNGFPGTALTLNTVTFPTNIVAANTSGGNSLYNSTVLPGGNAGNIKVVNSTIGALVSNGGNAAGNFSIGYNNGSEVGGTHGTVTNTNSTIGTITANDGIDYIPGCTDSSFGNYNPSATYSDGTCTNITGIIGIDVDNPVGNTVSDYTQFYAHSNYGIVNNDADYYEHTQDWSGYAISANYGTTTGYAYFESSGYSGGNYGYVGNGANFSGSSNYGIVHGYTYFSDWSWAVNQSSGIVNGDAYFGAYATNYGTVNGDAFFYITGDNQGTVTGTVTYYYGCMDPAASNYEPSAQADSGNCEYIGVNTDNPSGHTVPGPITFMNGTSNYGIVDGDAVFESGSYNYGTTTGSVTFNDFSADGSGAVYVNGSINYQGTGVVGGAMYDQGSNLISLFEFSDYQSNEYTVTGSTIFRTGGHNNGTVLGNAVFYDDSYNLATITGNAIFNDVSANSSGASIGGNSTFYGNSFNGGNVTGNAEFNDSSSILGGLFGGNLTINTDYFSPTLPSGGELIIENQIWNVVVTGTVYGSDNNPITKYIFNNSQYNNETINGDAEFNGYSHNNGTVNGNAEFNDSTYNEGTLSGNALFNQSSYNQSGSINGDVTFNTYHYSSTTPAAGVMSFENDTWNGNIGGVVYGGDAEPITDYIFYNSFRNESPIVGNAIFNDQSYIDLPVSGNVTFNTTYYSSTVPTAGTMLFEYDGWNKTVGGSIYGADNQLITNYVFSNGYHNNSVLHGNVVFYDSTINNGTIEGNATFYSSAKNEGTINGNATFNNNRSFKIGTVNGTVTLGGFAQTIHGVANIINLIKSALGRDTLYLEQGTTLNISGLTTLLGNNGSNLLTIRTLSPNDDTVQININGTGNLNYLRIKNIKNLGPTQDLSTKTIFDDGGNVGFAFAANTSASARGGVTAPYVPPTLPVSRGGTPAVSPSAPAPVQQTSAAGGRPSGTIDSFFTETIKPIVFKPVTKFDVIKTDGKNAGATYIPNPFKNFTVNSALELTKLPTNFLGNLGKFFSSSSNSFKGYPEFVSYLSSKGVNVTKPADIVTLGNKPIRIKPTDSIDVPGVFVLSMASEITYDKSNGTIIQLVKTQGGKNLSIGLLGNKKITGTLAGQNISFDQKADSQIVSIMTPPKAGLYTLKTSGSPILLVIQVAEPAKTASADMANKGGLLNWIKNLFSR